APRFAALGHARDLALGVALAVALAYMLLAGSPLPTIRALTMTGLFAVAIFLRRQPFSLNAIALAACIILLMWPESLFGPSFLLSFCVVLALVAAARASQARNFKNRPKYAKRSWISRGTAPLRTYFFGVLVTSLIATFVSMPISMYFFQDHSLVGIFANLAAVPLAAFWVMPMAVISLFLMPFGLDEPSLQLMGWGIEILVRLADTTAGWDTMNLWVPPMPPTVLAAYVFALCILCFHRSRLRLAAPLIWFVVAGIGYQSQAPHLLISPQPLVAGMTGPTGIRPVTTRGRQAFTIDRWTQAFVPTKGALFNQHEQNHTTNCDFEGCIWTLSAKSGANIRVAVTNSEAATARDCQSVDMLFTSTRLTEKLKAIYGCKAELIALDNKQLKAEAPVSLWISQPNDLFNQSPIVMKTYAERMKHRPWY
ncbi:MAG: ComEC/Rec2 family competence protein, partial [Alphaproteobacteria bacterium]